MNRRQLFAALTAPFVSGPDKIITSIVEVKGDGIVTSFGGFTIEQLSQAYRDACYPGLGLRPRNELREVPNPTH